MKKVIFWVMLLATVTINAAGFTDFNMTSKSIVRVYDGDTFTVNIPCSVDVVCKNISVRVSHVDAPEIHGTTQHEKDLAQKAKLLTAGFLKDSTFINMKCGRDKYFRLLCEVSTNKGRLDKFLLDNNIAKPYEGGTKSTDWTNISFP